MYSLMRSKKILIVDDSIIARSSLSKVFNENGDTVLTAANGKEAYNIISEFKPECVILDLLMPVMSGIELLTLLNEQKNEIPVIIHTADIQKSTRDVCLKLGAKGFLNKPTNKMALLSAVNKALAGNGEPQ